MDFEEYIKARELIIILLNQFKFSLDDCLSLNVSKFDNYAGIIKVKSKYIKYAIIKPLNYIYISLYPIYYEGEYIPFEELKEKLSKRVEIKIVDIIIENSKEFNYCNLVPKKGVILFGISFDLSNLEGKDCKYLSKLGDKIYSELLNLLNEKGLAISFNSEKYLLKVKSFIDRK